MNISFSLAYGNVLKKSNFGKLKFSQIQIGNTLGVKIKLQIKETLQIQNYSANKSLNVNIDSFECKLW